MDKKVWIFLLLGLFVVPSVISTGIKIIPPVCGNDAVEGWCSDGITNNYFDCLSSGFEWTGEECETGDTKSCYLLWGDAYSGDVVCNSCSWDYSGCEEEDEDEDEEGYVTLCEDWANMGKGYCSRMECEVMEDGDDTTWWLRGVGGVKRPKIIWDKIHQCGDNYISSLGCEYFVQFDENEINDDKELRTSSNLYGGVEYLTYDGFVEVVRMIESEYHTREQKPIFAAELAMAIAWTYYRGSDDDIYGLMGMQMVYPFLYIGNTLDYVADNYVLRHPEFYSQDSTSNVLYNKDGTRNRDCSLEAYGSPLGRVGDCLIKKVYLNGHLISMSHFMLGSVSRALWMHKFGHWAVKSLGGHGDNPQNNNGDALGNVLKNAINNNGGFYNRQLSQILEDQKFISEIENKLSESPDCIVVEDLQEYCKLYNQIGGICEGASL